MLLENEQGRAVAKPPITYDFTPNSLFRSGPDVRMNACTGMNGGPYDLRDYGWGFWDGAKLMVEGMREHRAPVDVGVYPVAFTYRHAIELYLKHLLDKLFELDEVDRAYGKNHGILELFGLVTEQISKADTPVAESEEVGLAQAIIADFNQIDPTGMVFRYPTDLKGNQHLIGLSIINVEVLHEAMVSLRRLLEGWIGHLEALLEARAEVRQAYRDAGWE